MSSDAELRVFEEAFWRALAHEVRTSLNHVCGGVELVLEGAAGPLSSEARTALDAVALAARQMFDTADTLLALARDGERPDRLDLFAAVRAAAETSVGAARLHVRPIGAERTLVRAAPALLAQLARATVAAQRGDPTATLTLRAIEADGRLWIELSRAGRRDRAIPDRAAWAGAVGRQISAWLGIRWREAPGGVALGLPPRGTPGRD